MRYFLKVCALTFALILGVLVGSAAWEFSVDPYNRFACAYNEFVERQDHGVVDLKKLHKMRAAWRDLEKAERWPAER